jgi:hypothetical protein
MLTAQNGKPLAANAATNEATKQEVVAAIKQMFEGMKAGDTTKIRAVLDPTVRLQTTGMKDGKPFMQTVSVEEWLKNVAAPKPMNNGKPVVLDERLLAYEVSVDAPLATAWTPYEFYIGDKLNHCGVNAFQLWKSADGWKILHIVDTRRKECGK